MDSWPRSSATLITERFQGRTDKIRYAISLHSMTGGYEQLLKNSLMLTKKKLKKAGQSSRSSIIISRTRPQALLLGENILGKGAEFCGIEINGEWNLGETVAIQNINDYSARDFERPERDPRLGMLAAKTGPDPDQSCRRATGYGKRTAGTIYDPFCGIGTILMEGLLMGINVVGSDLSAENIDKCHKNLDWLKKKFFSVKYR